MTETPHHAEPSLLARSVENISTVLGVWLPTHRHRVIHTGAGDVLVPVVALLLVQALAYKILQPFALLNIQVVQSAAGGTALALAALIFSVVLLRAGDRVWQISVGVLWALVFGTMLSNAALWVSDATSLTDWMLRRFGLVYLFALIFLICRMGWRGTGAFAGLIAPVAIMALPWLASVGDPPPEEDVAIFDPDIEMVYAMQGNLLDAQISRLRPGVEGKAELFAVLGAGYPYEGVFRREVEAVGTLLEDKLAAQDRVISLVNDDVDLDTYPLLNRVNLAASLNAIGQAMNEEDIALIFLTSHGAPGVLSTTFYEVITRDIAPEELDLAINQAGIGNAIIILPACYSGSFVVALQAPDRLILTGSDANSVSFGCNDQNTWTEWGRAFFVEALADTRDFREAARLARADVGDREKEEGLPPSSPQISEGSEIGRILDTWLAEFD